MKFTYRTRLLASSLLIGAALSSVPAMAQDAPAPADETQSDAPIVVTGSRIALPNVDTPSPVQSIGVQQIEDAGVTNIQELLLENPAFGTPGLSRTNSAFLTSGTGVATVDLRDLGSDRTLVLINGRRVVAGLPGSATVDLNVIPTQFLQRVDVLTGGASSIYGSDAVAGVVNFIYKDDFEGIEGQAQYNISEHGDDQRYQANLTFGGNFADDRGNIMVHLGYSNEGGLLSRDREETRTDNVDTFAYITGDPKDYGVIYAPYYSSFAPQGRFVAGGTTYTYDANNQLKTGFSTNGNSTTAADGFNRQYYRTIAVPVERYLFAARGHYDVSDSVRFIAEGTFSSTSSSREIEPFALSSDDIYPSSGGLVPIDTIVNGVAVQNPYVPAEIAASAVDEDGDGRRDISFARRLTEFGTRNGSTTRDLYRFVVGFEGDISDKFKWDVSYNYGQTRETQTSNGQVNVLNFANALQAVPDTADVNNNGRTDDVICASADARAQGCVPINIFGYNSITPEAAAYIAAPQSFQTRITQQQLQANVSGTVIDLPAGPLAIAVGAEYRRETSDENNDALTNAGLNGGNALPDTHGRFDVKELYGEINVPILADTPFAKELTFRAAGRVSDYSTVGTVYTWNLGGEWAPIDALRIRGTFSRSVRAPNIGELYTGPSQTFPSGLQDPCEGIGASGGGTVGDNCRADTGVAANIAANGVFTINQADLQGVSGYDSGNPNLKEERSRSWTLGATLAPRDLGGAIGRLSLSVDYYNINISDAIVAPPRQFILNQCYQEGNQSFCDLIQRRATDTAVNSAGSLEYVDAPLVNGGSLETQGLDVVAAWNAPVSLGGVSGRFDTRIAYTHLFSGSITPVPGADIDPFAGEIGTSKDRFTANAAFTSGGFRISFTGTYIGSAYEDDGFLASYDLEPDAIEIPAEFYLDTQLSYKVNKAYELYFGVDNLLDNDAPNILSGSPFNTTGTNTAADVYDPFGRRYYVGARLHF
ncbi:MAG: TonB-dependent receptor plug domain-containing protein [Pseudomonadota bacterium]